jgi:hypothetical protein
VVLQAMCRGLLARRQLQQLAEHKAAAEAAAAAAAVAQQAAMAAAQDQLHLAVHVNAGSATPDNAADNRQNISSGSNSSSRCSSGKRDDRTTSDRCSGSGDTHRAGSSSSKLAPAPGSRHSSRSSSSKQLAEQPLPVHSTAAEPAVKACKSSNASGSGAATADVEAGSAAHPKAGMLAGRQLVIRSAADMRTATQHGDGCSSAGAACTEHLARQLVWRAEELQVSEEMQQADLALRTSMAGSSFRKLQEAMAVVKSRRDTS